MTTPPWSKLAATLCLRRNLESAAFPAEKIGTLGGSGNQWQSHEQRQRHLEQSRKRHKKDSRDLKRQHGIRSPKQLATRIQDLRNQEEALWKQCRPDLYA